MTLESSFASAKSSVAPAIVMLEETVAQIGSHIETDRRMNSFLCRSLLRAGQALDSVDLLASRYRYQDMWGLCRILCELMINTCYLQVAPEVEFRRWSNYDFWTDERLISNLASFVPEFEDALDPRELERQREQRHSLKQSGLYTGVHSGSWSEKNLEERAQVVDEALKLERDVFRLLYRLTVKVGHSFVHVSPRGIGPQTTPILAPRQPSPADLHASTQALSMSATAVYAGINFTRVRKGLPDHLLASRFGEVLRLAFEGTMQPL